MIKLQEVGSSCKHKKRTINVASFDMSGKKSDHEHKRRNELKGGNAFENGRNKGEWIQI